MINAIGAYNRVTGAPPAPSAVIPTPKPLDSAPQNTAVAVTISNLAKQLYSQISIKKEG